MFAYKGFLLVVTFAWDQLVKQYDMLEKIMASIKSFAASVVKYGLMCLKLARLYLMVLATFLTCFLKVKFESKIIPRYLKSDTTMSFSPSIKTSACCTIEDLLEKNIQTVLLMLRCRSDIFSHSETCTSASVNLVVCSWYANKELYHLHTFVY